jgi:glycosyltransferase involved in cell wall biosynthesis
MLTVGVVIPHYNHSQLVREAALPSLLAQGRLPDRVILVDDGSKPNERDKVKELCRVNDIQYIAHPENWGPSAARNTGIKELLGLADIIICLDADDILAPGYVGMMLSALDANPEALVAYPDVQMFGFEQRVVKAPREYSPNELMVRPFIVAGAAFRAEMWKDVYSYNGRGWDAFSDKWGWEDYLFWMEGLLGVAKGDPKAAIHAGPDKFWYLYRRFNRPDRSDGNEQLLWGYMAGKMQELYGVTLPPIRGNWLER